MGFSHPMRGALFLISMVPWRSAWKYRERALRYCLLDAGHILGAIEASAYLLPHAVHMRMRIDAEGLHRLFAFDASERFVGAACAAVPVRGEEIAALKTVLPFASAVRGGSVPSLIEEAYLATVVTDGCKACLRAPHFSYAKQRFDETIFSRRSQRSFTKEPATLGQYRMIREILEQPVLGDCDDAIEIYTVVHRVLEMPSGVYKNATLLKAGDFSQKTGYLCLEQYHLCADGVMTLFMVASKGNYRALCQKAGIIGQRLYLAADYVGLGASGIGAFYDDEVAAFLGLEKDAMVLYAFAVGR
jgi:nitroreductase